MKNYQVIITNNTEQDIKDIGEYLAQNISKINAEYILNQLEQTIINLEQNPYLGNCPDELSTQSIKSYHEISFKTYRIIYEIIETKVIVHLCYDGIRELFDILEQRSLRESVVH